MLCRYTTDSESYIDKMVDSLSDLADIQMNNILQAHKDSPSVLLYYDDKGSQLYIEEWHKDGVRHRDGDMPAFQGYLQDGTKYCKQYYKSGRRHRDNGYAYINMFEDKRMSLLAYYEDILKNSSVVPASKDNSVDDY